MARRPHIVLRIGVTTDYLREIITGVVDYSRATDWVYAEQPWHRRLTGTPLPEACDGVIVGWMNYEDLRQVRARGIKAVCVTAAPEPGAVGAPRVIPDNFEIGRRAARYFLDKGFEHLAYVGQGRLYWSRVRWEGFAETAREGGAECRRLPAGADLPSPATREWLAGLAAPVGLLGGNDEAAYHLLAHCRELDLAIPGQVALLGVDNQPLVCDFADPRLSSIDPRPRRVGYEAAALLDRLLEGEPEPEGDVVIEPGGVIERQSTDILAVAEPEVAEAIRLIRARGFEGRTLEDILSDVPISRSTLERRFKEILGRTPGAELRRVRLERAREFLRETNLPLKRIAYQSGFRSLRHFSDAFNRAFGLRPAAYREREFAVHLPERDRAGE